jgi:hypothetical protein
MGATAALIAGPTLVFLAIMLPARIAGANLLATLLGVVAVVAVGFPRPLPRPGSRPCRSCWARDGPMC